MAIASTTNQVPYTGDGVSVAFAYPSPFITAADIKVLIGGVVQATGYTVTGTTDVTGNGAFVNGTVTFVTPPANGAAVIIYCDPDQLQTSVLLPNDPLPAKTVEKMVDKVTLLIQRVRQTLSQVLSAPVGEILTPLPAAALRANSYLLFDALGQPTTSVLGTITGQLATYIAPGVTQILNVPANYSTISAALAAIASWVIHGTVQIKVADGTYVPTATISLNHPFGQNIQLIGNIASPGNCILKPASPPTFDLLSVSDGTFGLVAGFRLDLASKAAAANNYTALLAVNGGMIVEAKNLQINNWYYQIAAREGGSQIYAHDCTSSNAGDVAVWGFSGGTVTGFNIAVTGANDSANNLGYGFQAEYGGVVDVTNSSATTCYRAGFAALSNGTGRYYTCAANLNTGSGFVAQASGVIEANGSSSTNNTRYGMEFFGAGTCTGLSTNTGNAMGVDNGNLYIDQGSLGARLAANGDMRIDVNAGNNWFFNSSGGVQFAVSHTAASVSWIAVTGSATSPFMKAAGPAANIDLNIQAKGTGTVFLGNNGANYLRVNPQASGTAPQLRAEGVDTDIDLLIGGKGLGLVRFGTLTAVGDAAMSGYITIKDSAGTTRKLMVTT